MVGICNKGQAAIKIVNHFADNPKSNSSAIILLLTKQRVLLQYCMMQV
jgi:hypothetical protein